MTKHPHPTKPEQPNEAPFLSRAHVLLGRGDYALALDTLIQNLAETEASAEPQSALEASILIVHCQLALGQIEDAVARVESLKSEASGSQFQTAVLKILEGWAQSLSGRHSEALRLFDDALTMLRLTGTDEWMPEALRWKGYAHRSLGDSRSARECMYESLASAKRRKDVANAVRARIGLARIYRGLSKFEEARELFLEAFDSFEQLGSSSMFVRTAVDLAIVERLVGNLDGARRYALRALATAEENNEDVPVLLSRLALLRAEFQMATLVDPWSSIEEVVVTSSSKKLFHPLVLGLEDRGDVAFTNGEFSRALADYSRAHDHIENPDRGEYPGELAWRIGLCHVHLGDLEKAHTWIHRGLEICEKSGDAKELALTIRAHGVLLLEQGNIEGGLEKLHDGLRRLQKIGVPFEVGRTHLEIAKAAHRFTRDRRGFDVHLEAAEDIFREMGAGLGLRLADELRRSAWNDAPPAAGLLEGAVSESILEIVGEAAPSNPQIRFASTTLGIHWKSPKYIDALDLVRHYSRSGSPLLITGETGVGKTALAEVAHLLGPNPREPFVILNCASLPETLLESELFGHVRGAFTGAERDNPGLIRSAGCGTVFLDEVDKASTSFQANLLHVLDRREIRAVGSHSFQEVKARFVVATNRDLQNLTSEGRFLPDLEFRISGLRVDVPPLRERIADLDLLLALALRELRIREGVTISITVDARNFLSSYHWPGNVRELFSVVLAAGILAPEGALVGKNEVDRVFKDARRSAHVQKAKRTEDLASRMNELEKEELLLTLRLAGGSQSRAAARLGITRRGLNKKLHRFGLLKQLEAEGLEDFAYRKAEREPDSREDVERASED